MAHAKAALDNLQVAFTQYKQSKSLLDKALKTTSKNERNITNKAASLSTALSEINKWHTLWVSKAGVSDEELASEDQKFNTNWLEALWDENDDLQQQAELVIAELRPVASEDNQIHLISEKMNSLKIDITSRFDSLLRATAPAQKSLNSASFKAYEDILKGVQTSFDDDLNVAFNELKDHDPGNLKSHCLQFEHFRRDIQPKILAIQLQLADQLTLTVEHPSPIVAHTPQRKGIEMEKSKAPTFSGRTIDYPEFKRGWQKVAGVCWEDENQVEQIKFKVDNETRSIISRCKTMAEVWKVLDTEFAQEQEVINAVDEELSKLLSLNCSVAEYIVKLRNHLPNLEAALEAVDGLDHLQSPDRVNILISRFDERTLHDWDYFRSKSSGSTYNRFFNFLVDRYDACRSSVARSKSSSLGEQSLHTFNQLNSSECRRCLKWSARDKVYTCPGCGRDTGMNENIHPCLEHCGAYMSMSANERSNCLEKAGWCPVHLLGTHQLSECNMKNDPRYLCGVDGCAKHHHKTLHGATSPFLANVLTTVDTSASTTKSDDILLTVQSIPACGLTLNCLFDNGATCSLITESAAKCLNLVGEKIKLNISTVTDTKAVDSAIYYVPLVDRHNITHRIRALQVDSILEGLTTPNMSGVKHFFPKPIQDQWECISSRPTGSIDLLIGLDFLSIHPVDVERHDSLRVVSSPFEQGLILAGFHPSLKSSRPKLSKDVAAIRHSATINFASIKPVYEYFESDNMGVIPPRRCGNCRNCKECSFQVHTLSLKEQYESQVIGSKINYDQTLKQFVVSYPFTHDPSILPNNKGQVIKIAEREEKRLTKSNLLEAFNREFDKMIALEALVELQDAELKLWDGPVHYVSLQHVLNEDSHTTPLRIVTNSSLSDRKGISLNGILMKGHDTLSDQWDVLTRWRSYEKALCSDVTKAYYALKTGELEKHVRRVCWRHGNPAGKWCTYGFNTVSFGDRPAASFLEIAIRRTAEMNQPIDPLAATRIKEDRYVDDLSTGGSPIEVARFMGAETKEPFQHDGTIPKILSKSSLHLKVMVSSGETDLSKIKRLGDKVLGIGWNPTTDELTFRFSVSLLNRKEKTVTVITQDNLNEFDRSLLTPRNLLRVVNSLYDPLGLVAPIAIRLRIAFRDLFKLNQGLDWDAPLAAGRQQNCWLNIFKMLVEAPAITFMRCYKPSNAVGRSHLICFFDGSDDAFAAVIYIRWKLEDGSIITNFLSSKTRVTPTKRLTTPRSELSGALLASRLALSSVTSLVSASIPIERLWFIGDSECILACLEKTNCAFGEYFGNRVGEILDNQAQIEKHCQVGEWWHTASCHNGADQATRCDSSPLDLSQNSAWQHGPAYLVTPISEWPINREFAARKEDCIPSNEILKQFRCLIQLSNCSASTTIDSLIDPSITNDWNKLIRITQNLLKWFYVVRVPKFTATDILQHSRRLWFLSAMPETNAASNEGRLKELNVKNDNGIIVIQGRASIGMKQFFGQANLPVIMGSTRIAYLIMLDAHKQDHAGKDITLATSRHTAWIVNASKLASQICKGCLRCRFMRRANHHQKMATLPESLQAPAPPFTNVGLDLVGPIIVKAMVNKRARMKVWVVIFLCLNTKAVSIELAPGYSTSDFLLAYSTYVSQRGDPAFVHSDRGSQLVSAQRLLSDDLPKYDWSDIASSSALKGTTWRFAPAGAQWRNGATEAFVKKFKKSFCHLYKNAELNYAELNCAVKRIANILNNRPVSAQRTKPFSADEDFLSPLTPNMLITGRNNSSPPLNSDALNADPYVRKGFIEDLEASWWYQYKIQCFHSLMPTRKWIEAQRNLAPGDVVLIQYASKTVPGTYRLGRILSVEIDNDELVRTCTVRYFLCNGDASMKPTPKEIRVPVQRLVLILPVEEQDSSSNNIC